MRIAATSRSVAWFRGVAIAALVSSACPSEDIPPCPGQCFAYTIPYAIPAFCSNGVGDDFAIPFTGPDGYRGRTCFNSATVPLVHEAIDHLRAGGQLSALSPEVQGAYESTVVAIQADLHAQCTAAAAGQCTNADQICTGIAADLYEQLIVAETCVLHPDGTEPVTLTPGQPCHAVIADEATGANAPGEHCPDATSMDAEAVDETASSSGIDGTGTSGGTGDTMGSMVARR